LYLTLEHSFHVVTVLIMSAIMMLVTGGRIFQERKSSLEKHIWQHRPEDFLQIMVVILVVVNVFVSHCNYDSFLGPLPKLSDLSTKTYRELVKVFFVNRQATLHIYLQRFISSLMVLISCRVMLFIIARDPDFAIFLKTVISIQKGLLWFGLGFMWLFVGN